MAVATGKVASTKTKALPAGKLSTAVTRSIKAAPKASAAAEKTRKTAVVKRAGAKTSAPLAEKVKEKSKKPKLVRDSFTMPEDEYAVLGKVKKMCLTAGVEVKKSQLLRIGLALLNRADLPALKTLLSELPPLKAGRPKKEK